MGYSNDHDTGVMEPNSVSLAMFASVGFHAVLFVLMAFFPAASETVKKPLRIVNLLPPSQSGIPSTSVQSQAKTSTLEDILQNPLPDLSAGVPPVGNTDGAAIEAAPNTSSYLGGNSSYNNRVNTSGLKTVNPPNRSFTPKTTTSNTATTGASTSPKTSSSKPKNSPAITPAPNPSIGQSSNPASNGILPEPPNVIGAVPEPFGNNVPGVFPDPSPSGLNPSVTTPRKIPPSQQTIIPIISTTVPYQYPKEACPNSLQGTATLSYYRQPDGTYVAGSGQFDNNSGSPILDNAALTAVVNATAEGTGVYQRYSSRFDFIYSEAICASASTTNSDPLNPTPSPEKPTPNGESEESESTKPSKSKDRAKSKDKKPSKDKPSKDNKDNKPRPEEKLDKGADSPTEVVSPDANNKIDEKNNPETLTPSLKGTPKPPLNSSPVQDETMKPSVEPLEPALNKDPVTSDPVKPTPSVDPVTPKPVTPSAPAPTSPVPEAKPTPGGDAGDLVPLEPVSPPVQPKPLSSPPVDLNVPPLELKPAPSQ